MSIGEGSTFKVEREALVSLGQDFCLPFGVALNKDRMAMWLEVCHPLDDRYDNKKAGKRVLES